MATKSFLKTVNITNRPLGTLFANALSKCENAKSVEVTLKSSTKEVQGEEAIKILNGLKK